MEDSELKEIIKESRKPLIIKLASIAATFFVTACIGLTAFYFNTNYVTAQNTKQLIEQKNNISKQSKNILKIKDDVSNMKSIPVLNQQQISNINKDISRIESKIERVDEKMERIVELLIKLERER